MKSKETCQCFRKFGEDTLDDFLYVESTCETCGKTYVPLISTNEALKEIAERLQVIEQWANLDRF